MSDRQWLDVEEQPLYIGKIDSREIIRPSEGERLKEALLGIADLAYKLEPGQVMRVERENQNQHSDRRMFTVTIYKKK